MADSFEIPLVMMGLVSIGLKLQYTIDALPGEQPDGGGNKTHKLTAAESGQEESIRCRT